MSNPELIARGRALAESRKHVVSERLAEYDAGRGTAETDPPEPPPDLESLPDPDDDAPVEPPHGDRVIEHRMRVLRIEREARRRLDEQDRPPVTPPPVRSLDALLAEPDEIARYRVDQLAPVNGRVMLAAQFKAGKTTLVGNLLRSLADGEPFLDQFDIPVPPRRIALLDTELDDGTLRRWLRDQGIRNSAALADVAGLRGRVASLNLLDDRIRTQWAQRLSDLGCEYLVLDCLRPILDALGLDEHRDAGRFLVAFDALLNDAGITDALLVQHMGHANERARGDSRLQDWPDALWRLVREDDNPGSPRFLSAYGRDVDVPEGRLNYDPTTRRLSFVAGSRRDAKTEAAEHDVIAVLVEHARINGEGLSGRRIEDATAGTEHTRRALRDALRAVIDRGLVTVIDGPQRSKLHRITNPCTTCHYPLTAGQTGEHLQCQTPP